MINQQRHLAIQDITKHIDDLDSVESQLMLEGVTDKKFIHDFQNHGLDLVNILAVKNDKLGIWEMLAIDKFHEVRSMIYQKATYKLIEQERLNTLN